MSKSIVIPTAIAAVDDEVTTDDENDVLAELGYYTSSTPSPSKTSPGSPKLTSRRSSRQLSSTSTAAHVLPRSRSASALGSKHVQSASVPSVPLPSPVSPSPSSSSSTRIYHRPFASTTSASVATSSPVLIAPSSRQRTTSAARTNAERDISKKLHLDVKTSTLSVASAARQGPLTPSPITAGTSMAVEWGYAL